MLPDPFLKGFNSPWKPRTGLGAEGLRGGARCCELCWLPWNQDKQAYISSSSMACRLMNIHCFMSTVSIRSVGISASLP